LGFGGFALLDSNLGKGVVDSPNLCGSRIEGLIEREGFFGERERFWEIALGLQQVSEVVE
jgi:hypothetical protein